MGLGHLQKWNGFGVSLVRQHMTKTKQHIHGAECCKQGHACTSHGSQHQHGPNCGHPAMKHDDHVDYIVDGHLHHPCMGHCDNHGTV